MLKRVSIQNFKSLKDVTLDLQKVNLLIGPNNSGKTNFLKALEFFSQMGSINKVTDFESISFKHSKETISFELLFLADQNGYMIQHRPETSDKILLSNKKLSIKDDEGFSSLSISSEYNDYFLNKEGKKDESIEVLGGNRRELFNYMESKIYRPDPSRIVHAAKLSNNYIKLESDGANIIPFYFYIFNNFEQDAVRIQTDFSMCLPEIDRFRTPPVEGENMLGLKFFDKSDVSYWASEVSEGVLYFLILLCIVNQPNPPKLLLLEEPEKGIHPRRIREVMDFVFRLAEEKDVQIILTTHNEHVLDDFTTRPESVFVFDKEEGATYVRNLQKDIIEPTNERNKELGLEPIDLTTNLSENWLYGLLGGVPAIP